jgi:ABC-type lipoprotein release transport system permease subunit
MDMTPRMGILLAWAFTCLVLAWVAGWLALSAWPPPPGFVSAGLVIAGFSLLVSWFANAAAGLASGAALAMVLTWVVNKAFFGWTVSLACPAAPLALTPVWLVAVSILAALVPAWIAARTPPAAAVRFE